MTLRYCCILLFFGRKEIRESEFVISKHFLKNTAHMSFTSAANKLSTVQEHVLKGKVHLHTSQEGDVLPVKGNHVRSGSDQSD